MSTCASVPAQHGQALDDGVRGWDMNRESATRATLHALSVMEHKPAWKIVDAAIAGYVDRMPAREDQKVVKAMANRVRQ